MVVLVVTQDEQHSALPFSVSASLFWSDHVYKYNRELFVDLLSAVIHGTKFLDSGDVKWKLLCIIYMEATEKTWDQN